MMKTRIITSIVALPILILPIYFGGISCFAFVFLLSSLGLYEFMLAYSIKDKNLIIINIAITLVYYILLWLNIQSIVNVYWTIIIILLLFYYVILYPKYELKTIALMFFGQLYIPVLLSYIALVRSEGIYGKWFVWFIFLIAFGSDSFAYFSGRFFGKHKLAKNLSPKKTIEGSIGGIIGAILLSILYGYYMYTKGVFTNLSYILYLIVLGGIGSILSQLGDLVASAIKRQNNIKDFGSVLPGHGGILDRFDSNIFTAPFVYYIMIILINHGN